MIKEFEGKTEKDAIDKAISEIGINSDEFDIEIVESQRKGLFKKGNVKIRIHYEDEKNEYEILSPDNDFEKNLIVFIETLISKMGFPGRVFLTLREERKLCFNVETEFSGILIGKKGKNLDAIQLLLNVYAGKLGKSECRIILDIENYRTRREENLVRLARKMADQVRRTGGSKLLEPMNPFERRLIHTALNDVQDIDTKSEGDGLYKQVRIIYKQTSY